MNTEESDDDHSDEDDNNKTEDDVDNWWRWEQQISIKKGNVKEGCKYYIIPVFP